MSSSKEPEAIVDMLLADMAESIYLGSMLLALSPGQRERLRKRWIKLLEGQAVLEHANY